MKRRVIAVLICLILIAGMFAVGFAEDLKEKEITDVRLLDSSKDLMAEGVLSGDTWTITLPADTDEQLAGSIGSSAMAFMQIEYKGASVRQSGGYDDAGQDSWASGNIMCMVSVGSQQTFTVTAQDGSTKDYVIALNIASPDEPGTGETKYRLGVSAPPGGTITPNVTSAASGESIIVTVTPDSGKRMVDGSLTYTLAIAGTAPVKITGNRFQMPNCDVTLSCQWETAEEKAAGISSFAVQGVSGVFSKSSDTSYNITLMLPHGTDVTRLIPSVTSAGVRSVSPEPGQALDFSSPVTFTVTLEDGAELTYVVSAFVSPASKSEQMWEKVNSLVNSTPWWKYAQQQADSSGKYPKYW